MKKFIFTTCLTTMAVFGFAEPAAPTLTQSPDLQSLTPPQPAQESALPKQGFLYLRFAAAENSILHPQSLLPGLGLGYRRLAGNGAADISITGIGYQEHRNWQFFWTAPKVSYLHYLSPEAVKSFYFGGGIGWGGLELKKGFERQKDFIGIIPSAVVGYEFLRKSVALGFTEISISQPAIAVYQGRGLPGPVVECTLGAGF